MDKPQYVDLDPIRNLARNIRAGSGNHGLTEEQLFDIFKGCSNPDMLAFTLFKCAEVSGKDAFTTQLLSNEKPSFDFTTWYHIDAKWDRSWGFEKTQPGCYIYGLFEIGPPQGLASFLDPNVIYIGESRAVTRNCMLGRRTDFRGTVRNERLSPYGCGTAFKDQFGKEKIDRVYQAYLPMHPSYCKEIELELLCKFFAKFGKIPRCNPPLDLVRVQKYLST